MPRRPKSEIEYRVYELPLDVPAIALHGPQWHISDEISSRLHFHNCAEIGICHSDEGMIVFEGGELVPFRAGDVTIIPQYVPHTTYSKQGTRSLWSYVFLDTEAFFSSEIKAKDAFSISADVAPASYIFGRILHSRVNFYANCLLEEFLEKGPDHKEVTKALCVSMYYELRRLWSGPDTKRTGKAAGSFALKPALDHIQRQYSSNLTVKELAEICCLSENHFRRLFLSIMGTSPLSFINDTRIKHACALLDTTDMSILAISGAVGMNSIASFNRNFKQLTGVSPRNYRNTDSKNSIVPTRKYILPYKGWTEAEEHPEHITTSV